VQGPPPDQAGVTERWALLAAGNGYRLLNQASRLVVEIWDSRDDPGVGALGGDDQVNKPHQHWAFEAVGDHYVLRAAHSKLVLAISQNSLKEGAPAMQWKDVPGIEGQLWELRPVQRTVTADAAGGRPATEEGAAAEPLRGFRFGPVLLLVGLVLVFLLVVWLVARQRRRGERVPVPVPPKESDQEPAPKAVRFTCSACGKALKAKWELAGKKVKCPECGQVTRVPGGGSGGSTQVMR
jgi:hypothetical protein